MKSFFKYWLPVLIWLGLIFIGSTDLLSAAHTSRIIGRILRCFNPDISAASIARAQFFVRKAGHLIEYAMLAILFWRGLRGGSAWTAKLSILFVITLLVCAAFAAGDEFHQLFVPTRTSSVRDVMIDIVGAFIGLTICVAVARRKVLKEKHASSQ